VGCLPCLSALLLLVDYAVSAAHEGSDASRKLLQGTATSGGTGSGVRVQAATSDAINKAVTNANNGQNMDPKKATQAGKVVAQAAAPQTRKP